MCALCPFKHLIVCVCLWMGEKKSTLVSTIYFVVLICERRCIMSVLNGHRKMLIKGW